MYEFGLVLSICDGEEPMIYTAHQYCAGDKIEKNEMGGACGTYGGRERCAQGFGGET